MDNSTRDDDLQEIWTFDYVLLKVIDMIREEDLSLTDLVWRIWGTSSRRATRTDPTSSRTGPHRKWMLLRMDMTGDRAREDWRNGRDRVLARRTKLNLIHTAYVNNVYASTRLEALVEIQFGYSVTCTQVLLDSAVFIIPHSNFVVIWFIYLRCALANVVCPWVPWYSIHDTQIWWTSCAHPEFVTKKNENPSHHHFFPRDFSVFFNDRCVRYFPSHVVLTKTLSYRRRPCLCHSRSV